MDWTSDQYFLDDCINFLDNCQRRASDRDVPRQEGYEENIREDKMRFAGTCKRSIGPVASLTFGVLLLPKTLPGITAATPDD